MIQIGKKEFKDSFNFKSYLDDCLYFFLQNITDYPQYTFPADGRSIFEEEEGISFYYTSKGQILVDRWMKRMEVIFDKYFPDDVWEEPRCIYYKSL